MTAPPVSVFLIELPWPPFCLTPNAKRRSNWRVYVKPAAKYRADCMWMTRVVIGRHRFAVPPAVSIAFYPPDLRARDDDGMIGAVKHARDGIADAIGHDDATWRPSYSFHEVHKPRGKIVVTLTDRGQG